MKIDFHSHILPGIDDGARDTDESLKILDILYGDGVDVVVATPHLYLHKQNIESFLEARSMSASKLFKEMDGGNYPEIVLGAEVYFSPALCNLPLEELCIQNTNYLLLELPYQVFTSAFLQGFANFINSCKVNVILAHVERYYEMNSIKTMDEILSYELLAQVNCDSFTISKERRRVIKFIDYGIIKILGTDAHNLKRRPPLFAEAEKIIKKKLSDKKFENMMKTAEMVLNNENLDTIYQRT